MSAPSPTPPSFRLAEIDPILAGRIREQVSVLTRHAVSGQAQPGGGLLAAVGRVRAAQERTERVVMNVSLAGWVVFSFAGCVAGISAADSSLGLFLLLITPAVVCTALGVTVGVALNRWLWRRGEPDMARAGLRQLAHTRAETLYADLVLDLFRGADARHSEAGRRETLTQANRLLDAAHALERSRAELHAAGGADSVAALEREREGLLRQAAGAGDPAARDALEQGAALCQARVEAARALAGLEERLAAQNEVLCQTLAALRVTAAHRRLGPSVLAAAAGGIGVRTDGATEVTEAAEQVARQIRSVEAAVQEVAAVRGGQ
jgi:hypothetical protein